MMVKATVCIVVAAAAVAAFAEKQPAERYQPIVDRQMFGRVPAGFDPTKPPSTMTPEERKMLEQQQEQLRSAIRLSAINKRNGKVAVGFTDSGIPSKPMHYYLCVGETRDGWLIKSADPDTAMVVIAKGDVEVTLKLGEDSASKADATARAGTVRKVMVAEGAPEGAGAAADAAEGRPEGQSAEQPSGKSLAERRRLRRQKAEEDRKRREQAEAEIIAEREAMKNDMLRMKEELEQAKTAQREQQEREEQERQAREEQAREEQAREEQVREEPAREEQESAEAEPEAAKEEANEDNES